MSVGGQAAQPRHQFGIAPAERKVLVRRGGEPLEQRDVAEVGDGLGQLQVGARARQPGVLAQVWLPIRKPSQLAVVLTGPAREAIGHGSDRRRMATSPWHDPRMGLSVCPVAIVAAPVEVVWANLVQWERYAGWADVQVERVDPEGPIAVGQTIDFTGRAVGRTWRFTFRVDALDPERHQIDLLVRFPFGLQEKPHIACTPIDTTSCRVQYG